MSVYVSYCQCRLGPPHAWEPDGACPPTPVEPLDEVGLTEKNGAPR